VARAISREELAFIDIDATQKWVYGHHKQGAAFGHTKIEAKPAGPQAERAGRHDQHTAGCATAVGPLNAWW
jgi:hypothetical protein